MNISTLRWTSANGWLPAASTWPVAADLVLYFGARAVLERADGPLGDLAAHFPAAVQAGCSTAGEIVNGSVSDGGVAALCVRFAHTRVRAEMVSIATPADSFTAATTLAGRLAGPDLCHVFVLSDGLLVNGSQLTKGFRSSLPATTSTTGGLAGDGTAFKTTRVGLGGTLGPGRIVAVGFYGDRLHVHHGFASGWEPFGPRRLITRACGNVLYSLDDQPALELYKRYLGDRATGLPSTGLLYPLQLLPERDASQGLVRTMLAINEAENSLTFAGDLLQGSYARLMKASGDGMIASAQQTAGSVPALVNPAGSFAVLVSCVGRRMILGQRIEEEIDAFLHHLGPGLHTVGFYSYGEISPSGSAGSCDLHNQTTTLSVFTEDV